MVIVTNASLEYNQTNPERRIEVELAILNSRVVLMQALAINQDNLKNRILRMVRLTTTANR
jgi:hypothetical protein